MTEWSLLMTRGEQTAWIVGAIVAVGLMILYFQTRIPEGGRNAECQHWYGMDNDCVVKNAMRRLNGY